MERSPDAHHSTPLREPGRASQGAVSTSLMEATIYRPGPLLALGTIITPGLVALASAAIALDTGGAIPIWLPAVFLLWIPLMPVIWLVLKSIRIAGGNLGVARPWQRWHEIAWSEITRAEERMGSIRITGSAGQTITFMPLLLRDGARLKRLLLLRLPSHVLVGALRQRAQQLVSGDIYPTPAGGLAGMLRARPRRRWRIGATLIGAAGVAGAVLTPRALAGTGGVVVTLICAVVALCGFSAQLWLAQSVFASEHGIEIALPFSARTRTMRWQEVEMVEITARERLLRLRSDRQLLCPGPGLLRPADRNALRAFIHEYCLARKVPLIHRHWLI